MRRIKAICYCLYYGLIPWQLYEEKCHYAPMSYLEHLVINLNYAGVWLLFRENEKDILFEKQINGN